MIIVDTGFWVALFNNKDQYHLIAQQTLAQYSSQPLITTWCVLTESCHLLLQRSPNLYTGVEKQIKLMNVFERHPQKFLLFHLENTHLERIQDLMKQYYCCNRTARTRHQCRKTTVLSCHRCLNNTGVEKMNSHRI